MATTTPQRADRAATPLGDPFRDNPILASTAPGRGVSWRSFLVVSVLLHAMVHVALFVVPGRFRNDSEEPRPVEIVFYPPASVEPPEIRTPEPPLPEPEPVEVAELKRPDPPPPTPKPAPRPEPRRVTEVTPEPAPAPPPKPGPKRNPKPREAKTPSREVRTAGFAKAEIAEQAARPAARTTPTTSGSFSASSAAAPARRRESRVVAAGSFGSAEVAVHRSEPARQDPVGDAGFGSTASNEPHSRRSRDRASVTSTSFAEDTPAKPASPAPGGRAVTSIDFDTTPAASPSEGPSTGTVRQGGFGNDVAPAPKPRERKQKVDSLDTPVEIVSKPKPIYTDDARELRIEGEIVLEVTFAADGKLRVIRVVDGLGHGLDDAAVEAARKIQFKPARRNGRPVDHTATLRVVFRLA